MLSAIYLQEELPMWMMNFHPENPFYWRLKLPTSTAREPYYKKMLKDPQQQKMYEGLKKTVLSDPCYMRIIKEVIEDVLAKRAAEGKGEESELEEKIE